LVQDLVLQHYSGLLVVAVVDHIMVLIRLPLVEVVVDQLDHLLVLDQVELILIVLEFLLYLILDQVAVVEQETATPALAVVMVVLVSLWLLIQHKDLCRT
jgi:hypothetical protein